MKKACKNCRIIFEEDKCPLCGESDFTKNWKGRIIILNAEESEIAKKMKLIKKGAYAIKTK